MTDFVSILGSAKVLSFQFPNIKAYDVYNKKRHRIIYKCQMCSKGYEDAAKLMNHVKEKHTKTNKTTVSSKVPESEEACFICGQTADNKDEMEKHMQTKHIDTVQTLKYVKCNFVAKDSEAMIDHEASFRHNKTIDVIKCKNGITTQCRWARQGRCRYDHSVESAPNVEKVKECRHGEACQWKAQGRCSFYHSDVGVQSAKRHGDKIDSRPASSSMPKAVPSRWHQSQQPQYNQPPYAGPAPQPWCPTPNNQWKTVPSRWKPIQPQQYTNPPPSVPPPSGPPQAWCTHGKFRNLGRFCVLRHFSDLDFLNLQMQMRK